MDNPETMMLRATVTLPLRLSISSRGIDVLSSSKKKNALRCIIAIVNDVERRGHALNEMEEIRKIAQDAFA